VERTDAKSRAERALLFLPRREGGRPKVKNLAGDDYFLCIVILSAAKNLVGEDKPTVSFRTNERNPCAIISVVLWRAETPTSCYRTPRSDSLSVLMCATISIGISFRGAPQSRRGNLISRPVILNAVNRRQVESRKSFALFCRDAKEEDRRSRIWLGRTSILCHFERM